MRKIVKWILKILSLVCAVLLLGAYASRYISPANFWPLSFLGLIFPLILGVSILFLILLLVSRSKASIILIGVILLGWTPIKETLRLQSGSDKKEAAEGIKIMSYNVRIFDNFKWSGKENSGQLMLDFVAEKKPDIVCFQEFMVKTHGDFGIFSIKEKLDFAPYVYTRYSSTQIRSRAGLAIFSKYPIINKEEEYQTNDGLLYIFADIKVKDDTIRVFNSHLASYHLNQDQINLIDSLITNNPREKKTEYMEIVRNMKTAYVTRATQAIKLNQAISESPYPVIIAGDFNDTPVGYSYNKISENLDDAFVKSGNGLGATYKQFMLPLRIDYLLCDPEIKTSGYKNHNLKLSDHRPIEAIFSLK